MSIGGELYSKFFNNDITTANKLAANAAQIALNHFEWRFATLVLHNSTMILGLSAFMQIYRKSVIIGKGTFLQGNESSADRIRQFVVFGSDLINLLNILDWIRIRQFDNTGKFIFICKNCDEREAMNIFWDHKIINLVFIKDGSEESETIGFTYSVYDNENCGISPPKRILRSCIRKSCTKMFPMKLKEFHKCQVIASTFIQDPYMSLKSGVPGGVDGDLLLLIGEALNATLKVMTPLRGHGWGMPNENGTWVGSFGDIYYDLANFSMTSAAITITRFREFHMSTDYNSISMVWVTHPAIPLPAWQRLMRPFQVKARISLAATFLFVVLVAAFVKSNLWMKMRQRAPSAGPRTCVVFYSWTICMGMPTTTLPSKPAFLSFFLLWLFYCFMIRTFYQASLIHAMKDNLNYPEFEDIEDILNSGYPLGGVPTLMDYFIDDPRVYNNWTPIDSTEIYPTMVNLSQGTKYVLAMNRDTTKSFLMKQHAELHIVPQKIVTSPTVLFFKKFSPMAEPINLILGRLMEAGFTDKLYKNHAGASVTRKVGSVQEAMNLEHYMGCYVVLAIGWAVSTISFVIEIYYYKCSVEFRNRYLCVNSSLTSINPSYGFRRQ